jgi:hypothetical protein
MLNVVMLNIFMLNVVMLNVIMLSVVMLRVVMQSVALSLKMCAPFPVRVQCYKTYYVCHLQIFLIS